MSVYMDGRHRLPQNKRQVLQNCLYPIRTIVPLGYPLNPSLVVHTPITVSAGEVAGEEEDTPISHTSHFTLLMSSAVNKLQLQRHPLNSQPPRPALATRNQPSFHLFHLNPKNAPIHDL